MTEILARMIKAILQQLSPALKTELIAAVTRWRLAAAKTPGPWDDIVADLILALLK